MTKRERIPIPKFMRDYPQRATELKHLSFPNYCINCQQLSETRYITTNLGPFCDECMKPVEKFLSQIEYEQ